ncbi:DUF4839 domain-containing protein [Arthrobacter sp. zg-Y1116]|uniref:DUF4839 domain-containing protein n=1 Tax=Arthrobacter sp. zg-Y1116 TaxID=2964611 RepID=UPI002104B673|nr:DUF4839 domain-containing protein [Arthrobacter sp. zg-Y1116]MCQ1946064.1 DUF4839 domain-containing protein [Arthrobacter sp. zg-Y1116]
MADGDVQYELKSVQAIRSTEARTIAKWEKLGWELVSQDKGTLRTEITFRRAKRQLPWRLMAVAGGALAVLIAVAAAFGLFDEEPGTAAPPAPVVVETTTAAPASTSAAEATPSEEATETTVSAKPVEDSVLTVENNTDLAELLITDTCSSAVGDFATKYEGQTIAFDANIGAMQLHGGYTTRYDILISAGDFSETTSSGPFFQYRDVNTVSDLRYADDNRPDTIGVGDNVRITAQVVEYESVPCQFILKPVSTEFR